MIPLIGERNATHEPRHKRYAACVREYLSSRGMGPRFGTFYLGAVMKKALIQNRMQETIDDFVGQSGKIGYALLWLIGIPLPLVVVLYLIFGN